MMPTLSKYHDEAIQLLKEQRAESVVVIVINGRKGSGCALTSTTLGFDPLVIAGMLHEFARQLETGTGPSPAILFDPGKDGH